MKQYIPLFEDFKLNEANYRQEEAFANSSADQFNIENPNKIDDTGGREPYVNNTVEEVKRILDTYEPDFEYTDKEIGWDSKDSGRAEEFEIWVDFSGVNPDVAQSFEREPDVHDKAFRQWCDENNLRYGTVMTGAQGESILFQVLSF